MVSWKLFLIDLEKSSDVVCKEVVKNPKFNILNTEANSLRNKIPDKIPVIQMNQYNTDKQT